VKKKLSSGVIVTVFDSSCMYTFYDKLTTFSYTQLKGSDIGIMVVLEIDEDFRFSKVFIPSVGIVGWIVSRFLRKV